MTREQFIADNPTATDADIQQAIDAKVIIQDPFGGNGGNNANNRQQQTNAGGITQEQLDKMKKPAVNNYTGTLARISKQLTSSNGDKVFRLATIETKEGLRVEALVGAKFYDDNSDYFQLGELVNVDVETTIEGKTEYYDKKDDRIGTHTSSGKNMTQISTVSKAIKQNAEMEVVANHLKQFEDKPALLQAMAMVYAGRK